MIRASEARKEARESLTGKWKTALLISLIYTVILIAINILSGFTLGILSIALIIIAPAISYGLAYSYYHLKNGDKVEVTDFLTVGFKHFGYSWKLTWNIIKKCWVYILIFVIAIILIISLGVALYSSAMTSILNTTLNTTNKDYLAGSYSYPYDYSYDYDYDDYYDYNYNYDDYQDAYDEYYSQYYDDYASSVLVGAIAGASVAFVIGIFVGLIVYIVFIVLFIRKSLLYALSYYVAVRNEGIEAKDAVLESERLMVGNRGRLFCLILSFIGWSILIAFVSGVLVLASPILSSIASYAGTIILMPYITFSVLAFYRDLEEEKGPRTYVNATAGTAGQVQTNATVVGANTVNNATNQTYNSQPVNNLANQTVNNQPVNNEQTTSNINNTAEKETVNTENTNNIVNSTVVTGLKKYCKRCGAENTPDATYCTTCGAKLD